MDGNQESDIVGNSTEFKNVDSNTGQMIKDLQIKSFFNDHSEKSGPSYSLQHTDFDSDDSIHSLHNFTKVYPPTETKQHELVQNDENFNENQSSSSKRKRKPQNHDDFKKIKIHDVVDMVEISSETMDKSETSHQSTQVTITKKSIPSVSVQKGRNSVVLPEKITKTDIATLKPGAWIGGHLVAYIRFWIYEKLCDQKDGLRLLNYEVDHIKHELYDEHKLMIASTFFLPHLIKHSAIRTVADPRCDKAWKSLRKPSRSGATIGS